MSYCNAQVRNSFTKICTNKSSDKVSMLWDGDNGSDEIVFTLIL
jgi:hypothetical protein